MSKTSANKSDDQTAPPSDDQTAPPSDDQTAPPSDDQTAPPKANQTMANRPSRDMRLDHRMRAALERYGLSANDGVVHACCAAAKAVLVDDED